jgi:mono/diheme cytochrome c family protein
MTYRFLTLALLIVCSAPALAQKQGDVAHGKEVFEHFCKPCHGDGRGDDGAPMLPGTHALTLKYRGQKPGLLEERTDLPAEVLTAFVRSGVASMPPFRKTEVTDADLAAVAAYLAATAGDRNSKGVRQ